MVLQGKGQGKEGGQGIGGGGYMEDEEKGEGKRGREKGLQGREMLGCKCGGKKRGCE